MPKGIKGFQKGHRINVGRKRSEETKKKFSLAKTGERSPVWRGNKVGYWGLHHWIRHHLGSAKECKVCGGFFSTYYEWANISGKYKRDARDFISLCRRCHTNYDWGKKRFNLKKFINSV